MITIRIKRARAAKGEIERKTPRNGDTSALLITLLIILRTELTHTNRPQTCGTLEKPVRVAFCTHAAMADRTAKGPSRDRVASAIALRLPLAPRTFPAKRYTTAPLTAQGRASRCSRQGHLRGKAWSHWRSSEGAVGKGRFDVPSWQRSWPIDVSGLVINIQMQKGWLYFEAEHSIGNSAPRQATVTVTCRRARYTLRGAGALETLGVLGRAAVGFVRTRPV